jgi:sugar lactone lactonase YvrE
MTTKLFIAVAVALAAANYAGATGGSVVASFESPHAAGVPRGMAYCAHHTRLYHVSNTTNVIYATNTDGSVVKSFPCPGDTRDVEGGSHYFWTCTYSATGVIYRINTTGSIEKLFPAPSNATGITLDATHLWVSSSTTNYIYRMTTDGSLVSSFAAPGRDTAGLDWDGLYLWLADAATGGSSVYQLTTTGSVIREFKAPAGRACGVAFDGVYVWYSSMANPKYCFRMTVGKIAVEPASFGKVKGLFK